MSKERKGWYEWVRGLVLFSGTVCPHLFIPAPGGEASEYDLWHTYLLEMTQLSGHLVWMGLVDHTRHLVPSLLPKNRELSERRNFCGSGVQKRWQWTFQPDTPGKGFPKKPSISNSEVIYSEFKYQASAHCPSLVWVPPQWQVTPV